MKLNIQLATAGKTYVRLGHFIPGTEKFIPGFHFGCTDAFTQAPYIAVLVMAYEDDKMAAFEQSAASGTKPSFSFFVTSLLSQLVVCQAILVATCNSPRISSGQPTI